MSVLGKIKKASTYIDPKGPKVGLGTYRHFGDNCINLVTDALHMGYRLIDTADHYNNHKEIGSAIIKSGVKRNTFILCTKSWRTNLSYEDVNHNVQRFLEELKVDYIDILLIHWPNKNTNIFDTLKAFKENQDKGYIKSYGVSNFTVKHLTPIIKNNLYSISYNQIEYHPLLLQDYLLNYCNDNKIRVMAHSGLAGGKCLQIKEIVNIAKSKSVTPAQVIYSWLIAKNIIPIVGISEKTHLQENFDSQFINLTKDQIKTIDTLNYPNYRHVIKEYSEFD